MDRWSRAGVVVVDAAQVEHDEVLRGVVDVALAHHRGTAVTALPPVAAQVPVG